MSRGFTLVELLVVISIIGVLVSLLLPAVQAARSAARRMMCKNHLHQIGIALHSYHQVHETFPPGGIDVRTWKNRHGVQIAWSALLLPYLEQAPLHEKIDFSRGFDSSENAEAAAVILDVYICPSVPQGRKRVDGRGPTQYGGIYGERITGPNDPPKGVMLYFESISIAAITDGTSQTLAVSEDSEFHDGQWINGRNVFDQAFPINAAPRFENDIRSEHPGGAHGLFCDGSVRFLSEEMKLESLAAVCTREGEEVIETF